jgi:transcriptional regulator with XRE-family HTH domain
MTLKPQRGPKPSRRAKADRPGKASGRALLLSDMVRDHRRRKGWSQLELAERAAISPRTVVNIEKPAGRRGVRFDIVVRLASALDQAPAEWLRMLGYDPNESRMASALHRGQNRSPEPLDSQQREPQSYFKQLAERIKASGRPALMVVSVTSPQPIDNKAMNSVIAELFGAGLHVALVSPYPAGQEVEAHYLRKPNLVGFYQRVFARVRAIAGQLRLMLPEYSDRIHVLKPRSDNATSLSLRSVPPPLGVRESRPCIILFPGNKREPKQIEVGAYVKFGDDRPDRWFILYPRQGSLPELERAADVRDNWVDYFGDICEAWNATRSGTKWSRDSLVDWQLFEEAEAAAKSPRKPRTR